MNNKPTCFRGVGIMCMPPAHIYNIMKYPISAVNKKIELMYTVGIFRWTAISINLDKLSLRQIVHLE